MSNRMPRRRLISGQSPFEATVGYSRAVRVGDVVEVAGTAPIWPDGSCPEDPGLQAERCFSIALDALRRAGGSRSDVVRTRVYLVDAADADAVGRAHARAFGMVRPASTMLVVAALLDPRWKVEAEVSAVIGSA